MRIHGVDFTSAPGRDKPLVCADARLEGGVLAVDALSVFADSVPEQAYARLAAHLRASGESVTGFDFPFSQSRKLFTKAPPLFPDMPWPAAWEPFARRVAALSREDFVALFEAYKAPRGQGDKQHKRIADELARAQSPQTLYYTPVGRMYREGIRLFLDNGFNIVPVRPTASPVTAVEAYPGLFVREMAGTAAYKAEHADRKKAQPDLARARAQARMRILDALTGEACRRRYGLTVRLDAGVRGPCLDDDSGDSLDSVLCALQAAWAWTRRGQGWGLPGPDAVAPPVLAFEGWIMDPHCRAAPSG